MYSGITTIYYRKTAGHVFTKPAQIEGTTQKIFSPVSCFYRSSLFCRQAMRVYVVRKWPHRGRSRFVWWNITRVSLWSLCNVYFMQSTQRICLQTRSFVHGINNLLIIAAVKNIDAPMLMRVWQELEYRIDVCPVIRGAHIKHLQLSKKLFQFSCGCEQFQ